MAITLLFTSLAAEAVPIIPGAAGFGVATPAGRGGTVYRVTNLNSSGSGSLRACVDASGPRVCVFEVSGYINISPSLTIKNPYITIAGQTAPSPGITLRGGPLSTTTSDVLIQHLRVRVGDDPSGMDPENRDAIVVDGYRGNASNPIRNIVIDHCSFSWSIDEVMSAWHFFDQVHLSNNIFAEPLHESSHPSGAHGFGVIFGGGGPGAVSVVGNLFAHMADRHPLSRATRFALVNNVIYDWKWYATRLHTEGEAGSPPTNTSIVGNVYLRGADYAAGVRPIEVNIPSGSQLYVRDNFGQEATSDPWSMVTVSSGNKANIERTSPTAWPAGLSAIPTANNEARDATLRGAGARPADRDSADVRIVAGVRNGTGRMINCVANDGSARCAKNAGGWPTLANNSRQLQLPQNPNGMNPDGYTNLEKWLHAMAAEVEGDESSRPNAPTALVIE